jgi:hypothetical protein
LGDADGFAFVAHDAKALVDIAIDALDNHWIVIVAGEDVAVDLEEVESLTAHAKEFAVFVEDCGEADTIMEKNFHDSGSKCCGTGVGDRLHTCKCCHTATSDEVAFSSLKSRVLVCCIPIVMQSA